VHRLRDRRVIAALAAFVATAGVLALVVVADDGDGAAPVATRATTSTSLSTSVVPPSTSTTVPVAPPPTTVVSTAPAPVTPVTTASTVSTSAGCSRPAPGSDFDGFGATEIVIQNAEGSQRNCVLTADTSAQQQRGLMRQDDLDGYAGMIFRFPSAAERSFWMRNTPMPLSIAFFDAGGSFVSATDMDPCGDSPDCPTYSSHGAAKFALEVARGGLDGVGATSSSRLIG
jgi:uncharacterized membrane protein (UPF0127 family)